MPRRSLVANLVGLVGCAAVAWGIHGLMLTGTCGGPGAPPCPDGSGQYAVAMAIGMPTAIVASILGGRLAFTGLFAAVAVGSLWAGLQMPADERGAAVTIGAVFAVVCLLPLVVVLLALRKRRLAARLVAEGGTAIGTVTEIVDTGVTVNKNPRVTLKLRIEPEGGTPAYDGVKTVVVSRVNLPYVGQRYPVWFDRDDPSTFALGVQADDTATPDVRRLFAVAAAGAPARPADQPAAGASASPADPLERLAKLNDLRLAGALTDAEFAEQKARILGGAE